MHGVQVLKQHLLLRRPIGKRLGMAAISLETDVNMCLLTVGHGHDNFINLFLTTKIRRDLF
jgi:hypothetical protein